MSAISQYTELFEANRGLIESNSAPVMNALRDKALKSLTSATLPAKGSENYEHTDLEHALSPDYGLNLARIDINANPAYSFRCGVPEMSTSLFLLINDTCVAAKDTNLPDGIQAGSLRDFAREGAEWVSRFYGSAADIDNPVTALDTLLAQDGFALHIDKGVKLERPIQLVNILNSGMPLMAIRRLLIVIEDDAEATLLVCDHTQNPDLQFLSLQTIEIFAGKRSRFDLYDLEESSPMTTRLSTLYLRQQQESNILIDGITLHNGTTRNEYHTSFIGSGASLKLLGMGIVDGSRCLESYSSINHDCSHCQTDELFKYSVDDNAVGSFTGRIYVAPGAVKTTAYQSNRNIVGSDNAVMFSKPQLEIYNDDVKCNHGTAIGQLDPMQLFYMRTRGLDDATARLLLKQAFMADVIDGVRMPALRDRLHLLVERRFAGHSSSCASCTGCSTHSNPTDNE